MKYNRVGNSGLKYNQEYTKKAVSIMKELHCPLIVNQRRYFIFDRIENIVSH